MKSVKVIDEDNSASIMIAPVAGNEDSSIIKEEEIKVEPALFVKSSADKNVLKEASEVQID